MAADEASAGPARRLSLLVLDPIGIEGWGGVERWFLDVALGLRDRGHAVAMAGRPGSRWIRSARDAGFPACEIHLRGEFHLDQAYALSRFMLAHGVDVVATKLHRGIRVSGFAAKFAGSPPVVAFMGLVETKRGIRYRLTYRLFLDGIVTLTEKMRREIADRGGFDPSSVVVIPQCLRADDFAVHAAEGLALRRELGLSESTPVALAIGRLHIQKRFDLMFQAFALVRQRLPDAVLLLAGHGRLLPDLERQMEKLALGDSVRLIGFRTDVARVLAAADCLFMSSDVEGVPVVALEAMAAGRPVVATDVGSVDAAVVDGVTGRLVTKGDARALADALVDVLSMPDRGRALGRAGAARVRAEFPMSRCVEETERYLLSIRKGAPVA